MVINLCFGHIRMLTWLWQRSYQIITIHPKSCYFVIRAIIKEISWRSEVQTNLHRILFVNPLKPCGAVLQQLALTSEPFCWTGSERRVSLLIVEQHRGWTMTDHYGQVSAHCNRFYCLEINRLNGLRCDSLIMSFTFTWIMSCMKMLPLGHKLQLLCEASSPTISAPICILVLKCGRVRGIVGALIEARESHLHH